MKIASVQEIKAELEHISPKELKMLCLRLARFKKENKELLTYILFEARDIQSYIDAIKMEVDENFVDLPMPTPYFTKKRLRKILRSMAKYSRLMGSDEAEIEVLIHFLEAFRSSGIKMKGSAAIKNLHDVQVKKVKKLIAGIHEDLQYDYLKKLEEIVEAHPAK